MFVPLFLQRWLLLNVVRISTIVACMLVVASTIRMLRTNFTHYSSSASTAPTSGFYASTDIPASFLGVFWSTLHHVALCAVLVTVVLSELSLPLPMLHRMFKNTLPFLGPNWGTAFLGVLLLLVSADLLSRPDQPSMMSASSWTLAAIGVVNVGVGVVWRAKAKLLRAWGAWKQDVANKMERLAEAKEKAERVVEGLPIPVAAKETVVQSQPVKSLFGLLASLVGKESKEPASISREAVTMPGMVEKKLAGDIYTPPLPSAVIMTRSTTREPAAAAADAAMGSDSIPMDRRSNASASTSSIYTLEMPSQPTPVLKAVRFTSPPTSTADLLIVPPASTPSPARPTTASPVATTESHEKPAMTSEKLTPPTTVPHLNLTPETVGPIEGERSPSVLASLQAAMLEAHAKASAIPPTKSLYLGSSRWRQEYSRSTESSPSPPPHPSPAPTTAPHALAPDSPAPRPYHFL